MTAAEICETPGTLRCARGYDLYTLTLTPSGDGPLRALVVYHHGFGEHCDRHIKVLRELCLQLNAVVVGYDVHGHGRSGPAGARYRAYVGSHKHLLTDLLDVVDKVAWPAAEERGVPKGKIFLMGHSMGGMATMLAGIERPGAFAGLLLTGPLVDVMPQRSWAEWLQLLVLRTLSLVIPAKPFLKRRTIDAGVRDPEAVKEIAADTMWYREPIKVRTVVSCINGTFAVQAMAKHLTLPLYIQQGTLDKTCNVIGIRRLLPKLGSKDVTYHEVQGGLHDLLLDTETPTLIKNMIAFVNKQL